MEREAVTSDDSAPFFGDCTHDRILVCAVRRGIAIVLETQQVLAPNAPAPNALALKVREVRRDEALNEKDYPVAPCIYLDTIENAKHLARPITEVVREYAHDSTVQLTRVGEVDLHLCGGRVQESSGEVYWHSFQARNVAAKTSNVPPSAAIRGTPSRSICPPAVPTTMTSSVGSTAGP